MNDRQLANLLTIECARLDATANTHIRHTEDISLHPPSLAPPQMFLWPAEPTPCHAHVTSPAAPPPLDIDQTASDSTPNEAQARPHLPTTSLACPTGPDDLGPVSENTNGKRYRSDDHETGYSKEPKSKRRPNSWWTLPEYSHLPKPTYAKRAEEKSANIRGLTRLQGSVTQDTGITSSTHPGRVESSCDNGTYIGIWPHITAPPDIQAHVPPVLDPDGRFLNVPAWDHGGDSCEFLPPVGQIYTGFDPRWDLRVPVYMTMQAVLEVTTDGSELEKDRSEMHDAKDRRKRLRPRRKKGKHAAARELAEVQRKATEVSTLSVADPGGTAIRSTPRTHSARAKIGTSSDEARNDREEHGMEVSSGGKEIDKRRTTANRTPPA